MRVSHLGVRSFLVALVAAPLATACVDAPTDDAPAPGCVGGKCDGEAAPLASLGGVAGVRLDGVTPIRLDARKNTYTKIGVFTLHLSIDPIEGEEGPSADHFLVDFELSPDDYARAFEGDEPSLSLPATRGPVYTQRVSAEIVGGARIVTLAWDNEADEATRKGELVLDLDDAGRVTHATVRKWHKRWLFGWSLVLEDELLEGRRDADGLLLRDDADLGQVATEADIRAAVAEPTPAQFRELVDGERP